MFKHILIAYDGSRPTDKTLGHRGKNLLTRWLVGSVSRQVIDHASCSVTVVR